MLISLLPMGFTIDESTCSSSYDLRCLLAHPQPPYHVPSGSRQEVKLALLAIPLPHTPVMKGVVSFSLDPVH